MKKLPWFLAICCAVLSVGCEKATPSPESGKAERAAKARELHQEYVERLYTEVLPKLDQLPTDEAGHLIEDKALGLFHKIYGPHQELLRQMARDTLAALNEVPQIEESQYYVMASETFKSSEEMINKLDSGKGNGLSPAITELWRYNVLARANFAITMLMTRMVDMRSFANRRVLDGFARPAWEIADRDTEQPRLVKRMGPEIIAVDIRSSEIGYDVTSVRWLRHKSLPKPEWYEPVSAPPAGEKDERIPKG